LKRTDQAIAASTQPASSRFCLADTDFNRWLRRRNAWLDAHRLAPTGNHRQPRRCRPGRENQDIPISPYDHEGAVERLVEVIETMAPAAESAPLP